MYLLNITWRTVCVCVYKSIFIYIFLSFLFTCVYFLVVDFCNIYFLCFSSSSYSSPSSSSLPCLLCKKGWWQRGSYQSSISYKFRDFCGKHAHCIYTYVLHVNIKRKFKNKMADGVSYLYKVLIDNWNLFWQTFQNGIQVIM